MNKFIANWWRSQQFKLAISRGNTRQAMQLLQEMQKSGARLSWLEKLFRDKLQLEIYSQQYKQEVKSLKNKLNDALQELENINTQEQNSQVLVPEQEFIESVYKNFNLKYHDLQYRGLQFWRRYIESRKTLINAYFRFVTDDIFNFNSQSSNLPEDFFDFIIISHCFFLESQKKQQANSIYQEIINTSIKRNGYVILIIQDKKLFKSYDMPRTEDISQEQYIVNQFVSDLDLELVWYRYLTSRDSRKPCSAIEFAKFADEKLPKQLYMTSLIQKYFDQRHNYNY
ncbi:photosystem II assembly protein, partial [Fischerella thermalis CCMEE 5198]|uniref:photosystem II assembly protein n=1 Tax=Fischerella thermalis TaxID=372787 RepID=UPI000C802EE0